MDNLVTYGSNLLQPNEGKGFEFVDAIVGGAGPKRIYHSVKIGLEEALENGVLAGYPVLDVKANYMMVLTMMSIHQKWH